MTSKERKKHYRKRPAQTHDTQRQRIMGASPYFPRNGGVHHLQTGGPKQESRRKSPVIGNAQRRECVVGFRGVLFVVRHVEW
jgi:hypothetical protein